MRIGNPAALPIRAFRSEAHYPSWGSETICCTKRRTRRLTHYPSWGSETTWRVNELPVQHSDSLPLMGIGNPGTRRVGSRVGAWNSLPLMGIGNPGTRRVGSRVGAWNSLPLMGIGNRTSWRRRGRCGRAHYPSWGSETGRRPRVMPTTSPISLPLMGIGNSPRGLAPVARSIFLITPHGDRKLRCRGAPSAPASGSLPLMGIGNGHAPRPETLRQRLSLPLMGIGNQERLADSERTQASLITPHGDRKRKLPRVRDGAQADSLPLMGIGNSRGARRYGRGTPLITPHGDRKHARVSGRRRVPEALTTPHGDRKLGAAPATAKVTRVSLPLMGIGNRRASFNVGGRTWFSLPLMGIGNQLVGLAAAPRSELLITPHGDRKPVWGIGEGRHLMPSLPLMGIGNMLTLRPGFHIRNFSLPLMGIGNKGVISRISRTGEPLITPHGDRKPARLTGRYGRICLLLITPHGDRKPRRLRGLPRGRPVSLPLMGIGNPDSRRSVSARRLRSLPLMGIGNGCWRACYGGHETAHYPSWGSKTPELAPEPIPFVRLITPHGDRKRNGDITTLVNRYSSLPLMGIGNPH